MTDESPPIGDDSEFDPESKFDLDAEVPDADVRGMVESLKPQWEVESITRSPHGTDFVAILEVRTRDGGRDETRRVVLKATTAGLVPPEIARSEPRLLELVGRETDIPVPEVFGFRDDHDRYPAPYYLMKFVQGQNCENDAGRLSPAAQERIVREAGWNLAELHELGTLPADGMVGVQDGELTVLDTDEHARYDDTRDRVLAGCESTLDSLEDGGFFPELAADPARFADLVPDLRTIVRERIPNLPEPDPPTYCHTDYRYGNLLVDPETGATRAVLDWARLAASDPAYNLASAESLLLDERRDGPDRTESLRRIFRDAYAGARDGWTFDRSVRERIRGYRLDCQLSAMACLPLWYEDPEERNARERGHRGFFAEYLS